MAVEIKICVVGEIDHGRGIGRSKIVYLNRIVVADGIDGHYLQIAGITGISVGTFEGENHLVVALGHGVPHLVLESVRAAMKMIGTIVDRQLIKLAVHRNFAVGNSVGETAGSLSGTGSVGKIRLGVVIAKNYVEFLAGGLRLPTRV